MSDLIIKLSDIKEEIARSWEGVDTIRWERVFNIFNSIELPKTIPKNIETKIESFREYLCDIDIVLTKQANCYKEHEENLKEPDAFYGYTYKIDKENAERKKYDRFNKEMEPIKFPAINEETIYKYVDDILIVVEKHFFGEK